jgi:hypothetical protein
VGAHDRALVGVREPPRESIRDVGFAAEAEHVRRSRTSLLVATPLEKPLDATQRPRIVDLGECGRGLPPLGIVAGLQGLDEPASSERAQAATSF